MVDKGTIDEIFDMTTDDLDAIVELFTDVDDVFDMVEEVFVEVLVVDGMSCGAPFGAGDPLTTSIQKPSNAMEVERYIAAHGV